MSDSDSTTLTDSVAMDAGMNTDHCPRRVDDLAAVRLLSRPALMVEIAINKFRILSVRYETNLLRLGLIRCVEIRAASDLTDLFFIHFAQGKICTRQLFLIKFPEEIALVFG